MEGEGEPLAAPLAEVSASDASGGDTSSPAINGTDEAGGEGEGGGAGAGGAPAKDEGFFAGMGGMGGLGLGGVGELGKVEMPTLPSVDLSGMTPDLSSVTPPGLKMEMPKIEMPKIEAPKIEAPDMGKMMEMPEMPKLDTPDVAKMMGSLWAGPSKLYADSLALMDAGDPEGKSPKAYAPQLHQGWEQFYGEKDADKEGNDGGVGETSADVPGSKGSVKTPPRSSAGALIHHARIPSDPNESLDADYIKAFTSYHKVADAAAAAAESDGRARDLPNGAEAGAGAGAVAGGKAAEAVARAEAAGRSSWQTFPGAGIVGGMGASGLGVVQSGLGSVNDSMQKVRGAWCMHRRMQRPVRARVRACMRIHACTHSQRAYPSQIPMRAALT